MPQIADLAAKLIRQATDDLIRIVGLTPEERRNWSPLGEGRTVADQLNEVVRTLEIGARTLKNRGLVKLAPDEEQRRSALPASAGESIDALRSATQALIEVILTFPISEWDATLVLPFGEGRETSFAELAMMHYWHLTYHYAQISYIQTLYGDRESW